MAANAPRQSSGVSGPAYANASPRQDPIPAASAGGPSAQFLRSAWEAYEGRFMGPLQSIAGGPDLNVIANRIAPIVRTGVDFLFGPVLKMQAKDANSQAILDATWGDDDQRMTTLSKSRINGGVYGHVFIKIVTPKNTMPLSEDNPPRIVVQNPEMYQVETDPTDCEIVRCYTCTWESRDDEGNDCWRRQTTMMVDADNGADETYNDQDDPGSDMHWEIQNWVRPDGSDEGGWVKDGPVMLWPHEFAPIVDWQNYPCPNTHWGTPDIDDSLVNLNQALHLVESNTASTLYSHGHPWLFNTGNGDTTGIQPTPGSITDIPGGNIQAVSAQGDMAGMQTFAAQIRANMDEASSTPGVATGRMTDLPRGQVSGITIRLLYGPRLMRMEHERRLYGRGVREICRRVLILCGQAAADDDLDLTWQDPLPQDDLAMAQMATTLQQLGVSKHSIFAMIGLDYETEQEYAKQEAQDQLTAMAHGQGLPPVSNGQAPTDAGGQMQQPGQQQQQNQMGNGGTMPPTNHPAAVAQRNATRAVAQAMRSGASVKAGK